MWGLEIPLGLSGLAQENICTQGKPLDSLSHVTRPEDKTKENNKMQGLAMQPAQAVLILWHSGNVLAQSLSSWHYGPVSS